MRFFKLTMILFGAIALSMHAGCGANMHRDMSMAPAENASGSRIHGRDAIGLSSREEMDQLEPSNTEAYDHIDENDFLGVLQNPQSTFAIDVDTASYSNVRRMLNDGIAPPAGAVRIEEMINYFSYDYPQPTGPHPFSVVTDLATCPWATGHQLVRIALKGKESIPSERPPSNLVFLLDVSGSMDSPRKLPLVKSALRLLIDNLDNRDSVSLAVYASASGLVLPPTTADQKSKILSAIDKLSAGGSTNGGQGIHLAYKTAEKNFIQGGINRVILCTDGDFNVGISNQSDLVDLITEKAKSNIYLSVLGFGTGNYKDSTMELLADKGNGNYAYIDNLLEARKSLVKQMGAMLVTIAKDVKIQIDFNPNRISAYRLIGYENRMLKSEDFEDDTKDAGEIGAGHTVTALYEIVPTGSNSQFTSNQTSDFVETKIKDNINPNVLLNVSLRYKRPEETESIEFGTSLYHEKNSRPQSASSDFQFAASVAAFGMLLRSSKFAGDATYDWVLQNASNHRGEDQAGFRAEFIELVKRARMTQK